mmetsp:Transcript_39029/g.96048  ORF Transcript_39029/g.96048 Transcript_39029/m.96048 type:complete len:213 (-) Transcript_39029:534-1172(-)
MRPKPRSPSRRRRPRGRRRRSCARRSRSTCARPSRPRTCATWWGRSRRLRRHSAVTPPGTRSATATRLRTAGRSTGPAMRRPRSGRCCRRSRSRRSLTGCGSRTRPCRPPSRRRRGPPSCCSSRAGPRTSSRRPATCSPRSPQARGSSSQRARARHLRPRCSSCGRRPSGSSTLPATRCCPARPPRRATTSRRPPPRPPPRCRRSRTGRRRP